MKLLVIRGTTDLRAIPSRVRTKVELADVVVCVAAEQRRLVKHADQPQVGVISNRRLTALRREADQIESVSV